MRFSLLFAALTVPALAGGQAPKDRVLDGYDLSDALRGKTPSPRDTLFYYGGLPLSAVRHGAYKAYFTPKVAAGAVGE